MDNSAVQLVGTPCGQHGPYTFYKAFKYAKNGLKRIVKLSEFFFVKLWSDSDLVCIGELQLLWVDKNSEQVLSSLRLYFLPENTPEGRMDHGEDEVLAISEKVVLRLEDLKTWITLDAEWTWGRLAKWEGEVKEPKKTENETKPNASLTEDSHNCSQLDKDKEKEKEIVNDEIGNKGPSVVILSYPSYCRYRAMMKRLEGVEDEYFKHTIVKVLGGFSSVNKNTRVLFCRDTFDYPELEGHELLCNHLAPKLKGRPRGRRKKRSLSPGSESNESESSISNVFNTAKTKLTTEGNLSENSESTICRRRSTRASVGNIESKEFMKKLHSFMKTNHTPIGRIPSLGYRELDLYTFFTKVDKLGGYDAVTSNRLWKSIFDDLSGNYISTSAATVIRRHYERFLLPYERHLKGEEYKPSTSSIKRTKSHSCSGSDVDSNESTRSGNSTPVPQLTVIPIPSTSTAHLKESKTTDQSNKLKSGIKTSSSLRSVRVKPERLREQVSKDKAASIKNSSNVETTKVNSANNKTLNEYSVEIKSSSRKRSDSSSTNNSLTVELITTVPSPVPQQTIIKDGLEISSNAVTKTEPSNATIEKIPISQPFNSPLTVTVQKSTSDKVTSADGKENIATCNTNSVSSVHNFKDTVVDLTEVPYKPKTPEIAHLDTETTTNIISSNNLSNSLLHSVKKRKLDILKEGGLEVTPVKPTNTEVKEIKENRPTVIHHPTVSKTTAGQLSITLAPDKQRILTSSNSMEISQRTVVPQIIHVDSSTPPSTTNSHPTKPGTKSSNNSFLYMNGHSPPKVVQSRSIYSYSEKTVYGNPKDYFVPPLRPAPHAPRFIESSPKHMGGEILDLTVKSPQKPVVEIMRVPTIGARMSSKIAEISSKKSYKNSTTLPVLDARVSSNLEITLVGPNSNSHSIQQINRTVNKYNSSNNVGPHPLQMPVHTSTIHNSIPAHGSYNSSSKIGHKRTFNGNFVSNRKEENGRLPYSIPPTQNAYAPREHRHQNNVDFNHFNSYSNRNSMPKIESSRTHVKASVQPPPNLKSYAATPTTMLPGYFTQLSMASKLMPPYVPPIDPLYYSALQSLYPHNPLPSVPPFFSVPTPDQLQFYTDIMARNSQMRYPFPYSSDGHSSVMTANTETNNYKK